MTPTIGRKVARLDPLYSFSVRGFAVIALLLGLVVGCGGASNEAMPSPDTSTQETSLQKNGGERAPQVAGITLDGARASLSELRGRPVFVNVWSSW